MTVFVVQKAQPVEPCLCCCADDCGHGENSSFLENVYLAKLNRLERERSLFEAEIKRLNEQNQKIKTKINELAQGMDSCLPAFYFSKKDKRTFTELGYPTLARRTNGYFGLGRGDEPHPELPNEIKSILKLHKELLLLARE